MAKPFNTTLKKTTDGPPVTRQALRRTSWPTTKD